ncbi:ribose import ATP-binding protein RbsA 1-like [Salvia splendens]|uniref:ribose import ATP-binding protein RbsA 1-like n=1 Tax=Salvia splendens TaxID=180675 RepID=UPI001C279FB7|nr:ribose import ATP-binding protein RbsA 1-like [Salvia splendens]
MPGDWRLRGRRHGADMRAVAIRTRRGGSTRRNGVRPSHNHRHDPTPIHQTLERQRAVLTPAPAVASIPRLGFGDDSSIHGPQQATQPGASSGARYTVKGDGDRGKQPSASVAIEGPSSSTTDLLLQVKDLSAVIAESKQPILKGVNLTVRYGEVHVVMGKNDSGKSTFAKVLAGHPDYEVTGGSVMYKGLDLREMEPEERATAGLFMSFQSSVEIPGVSNIDFLNMAYNARRRKLGLPELGPIEFYGCVAPKLELVNMKTDFLYRYVNEGFSGGEKKRNDTSCLSTLGSMDKLFVLGWSSADNIGYPLLFNDGGDEGRRLVVRCVFDPGGDVSPKSTFNSLRCFVVSTLRTRWILTVGELIRVYYYYYLV